jgi:hypothetical protein
MLQHRWYQVLRKQSGVLLYIFGFQEYASWTVSQRFGKHEVSIFRVKTFRVVLEVYINLAVNSESEEKL